MATDAPGLWIDDRYRGSHGIGRYAHEVTSRLTVPWSPLGLSGRPANPLDAFRRIPRDASQGLVYSPGYGALLGARRQILTIHDLIHLKVDWPGRAKYLAYYDAVLRPVARRNKVVLTVSETSRRAIEAWLQDDAVEVVNAGVGCSEAFTPDGPTAGAQEPYLLYVGNLRPHKNLGVVLDALTRVEKVRMKLVLPTGEMTRAEIEIGQRGLTDRVDRLSGSDDDELSGLYRGALATVFPSVLEGFGLPPLESIMCGTPVIYWSGCEAVAETCGARGRAVVSAADAVEWAETIEAELETPTAIVPPLGEYRWSDTAAAIDAVLRSRLDARGVPA